MDEVDKKLAAFDRQLPPPPAAMTGGKPLVMFPKPIPASELKAGDQNGDWFWHGYFARHTTTLFSSLWKAGKTTLFAHLLKTLETGGVFCGQLVRPTRVLYVSEEPETIWAARRDKIGIRDHVHYQIRPFKTAPNADEWQGLLDHLRREIETQAFGLVFIDPLTTLWPVRQENEAGPVSEALTPLRTLTDKAGVVLAHHFRKSDGTEATGSRGSGALMGFVDTIVELRRHTPGDRKDTKRVISGWGRFSETPDELVVELTDDGYVAHGDRGDVSRGRLVAALRQSLTPDELGWTYDSVKIALNEAMGGTSPTKSLILDALEGGVVEGWIARSGEGRKGDPHRYRLTAPPNNPIPD